MPQWTAILISWIMHDANHNLTKINDEYCALLITLENLYNNFFCFTILYNMLFNNRHLVNRLYSSRWSSSTGMYHCYILYIVLCIEYIYAKFSNFMRPCRYFYSTIYYGLSTLHGCICNVTIVTSLITNDKSLKPNLLEVRIHSNI